MKKPNVLFIMCDQLRYDALGCTGGVHVRTPHLDRLAAEGVQFDNAFTPNPICVPARASLTTGCYPHKCTGKKNNSGEIGEAYPKLGEQFTSRGYQTYVTGKLHYNPYKGPGEARTLHGLANVELAESGRILQIHDPLGRLDGLEDYHDYLKAQGWGGYTRGHGLGNNDVYAAASPIPQEHYVDTWVASRSIEKMKHHARTSSDSPFFVWASFPKPHSAYDPPRPYDQMYDPRQLEAPAGDIGMLEARGLDLLVNDHYRYMWNHLSPEAKNVIKSHYYGLISHQDAQVGRMLDYLDEAGLAENTIVVYTTDHGEMLGDFGLYFKSNMYNGSVRIPLIIRWPGGLEGGRRCDELAGLQDLLPTLLSLTGSPLDCKVDGLDLSAVLEGAADSRSFFVAQCKEHPQQQYMVADKRWKYVYHEYGGVEELYDQLADKQELHNRLADPDEEAGHVRDRMRRLLIQWCEDNGDKQMLDHGRLRKVERNPDDAIRNIDNPFGRRFY